MTKKEIFFTTSWNLEEYKEIVKENYEDWDNLSEGEQDYFAYEKAYGDYEDNFMCLSEILDMEEFVMIGTAGVWNGTFKAYKLISDISEFQRIIYKYDDIEIYRQNKKMFVELSHHDGTHSFELLRMRKNKNIETLIKKEENGLIDIDFDFSKYCKKWG